jgi:hypothetical protein
MAESNLIIHTETGGEQIVIMPEASFKAIERKLKEHGIDNLESWLRVQP